MFGRRLLLAIIALTVIVAGGFLVYYLVSGAPFYTAKIVFSLDLSTIGKKEPVILTEVGETKLYQPLPGTIDFGGLPTELPVTIGNTNGSSFTPSIGVAAVFEPSGGEEPIVVNLQNLNFDTIAASELTSEVTIVLPLTALPETLTVTVPESLTIAPIAEPNVVFQFVGDAFKAVSNSIVSLYKKINPAKMDFGDAPDKSTGKGNFPSLLSSNGARHQEFPFYLGKKVGAEKDSNQIDKDDLNVGDDDGGALYATGPIGAVIYGVKLEIHNQSYSESLPIYLNVLYDANDDLSWTAKEHIVVDKAFYIKPGESKIYSVPNINTTGKLNWLRATLTAEKLGAGYLGAWPTAFAYGETEDYFLPPPQTPVDFPPHHLISLSNGPPTTGGPGSGGGSGGPPPAPPAPPTPPSPPASGGSGGGGSGGGTSVPTEPAKHNLFTSLWEKFKGSAPAAPAIPTMPPSPVPGVKVGITLPVGAPVINPPIISPIDVDQINGSSGNDKLSAQPAVVPAPQEKNLVEKMKEFFGISSPEQPTLLDELKRPPAPRSPPVDKLRDLDLTKPGSPLPPIIVGLSPETAPTEKSFWGEVEEFITPSVWIQSLRENANWVINSVVDNATRGVQVIRDGIAGLTKETLVSPEQIEKNRIARKSIYSTAPVSSIPGLIVPEAKIGVVDLAKQLTTQKAAEKIAARESLVQTPSVSTQVFNQLTQGLEAINNAVRNFAKNRGYTVPETKSTEVKLTEDAIVNSNAQTLVSPQTAAQFPNRCWIRGNDLGSKTRFEIINLGSAPARAVLKLYYHDQVIESWTVLDKIYGKTYFEILRNYFAQPSDDMRIAGHWTSVLRSIDAPFSSLGSLVYDYMTLEVVGDSCTDANQFTRRSPTGHVYNPAVSIGSTGGGPVAATCGAVTLDDILPDGNRGSAYSSSVTASATGAASFTYAVTSGALPTALSLNTNTGAITGTPNTAGTFTFTITATADCGSTGSRAYSVDINILGG